MSNEFKIISCTELNEKMDHHDLDFWDLVKDLNDPENGIKYTSDFALLVPEKLKGRYRAIADFSLKMSQNLMECSSNSNNEWDLLAALSEVSQAICYFSNSSTFLDLEDGYQPDNEVHSFDILEIKRRLQKSLALIENLERRKRCE